MNFFRHVLKVALILGLIVGLFIFSVLLYVSDFGSKSAASADAVPVAAASEPSVATISQPIEMRTLYWIFGEPDHSAPPPPEATSVSPSEEGTP